MALELRGPSVAALSASYATVASRKPGGLPAWRGRDLRPHDQVLAVHPSPPTVAALATTSAITSAITWPSLVTKGNASQTYPTEHFRYLGASSPVQYGNNAPDYDYVKFSSFTTSTGNAVGAYAVEFYHYGTQVEFLFKGLAGQYAILVDDKLTQAAPYTATATGSQHRQLITFASAAVRKIRFVAHNLPWGGVNTGPTDMIWPTERRGLRAVVLGDSYAGGSVSTGNTVTGWARYAMTLLGIDDVFIAYTPGSGYLNPGSGTKFRDRAANDVIAQNPDIVIVAGGKNDDGYATKAAIQAEATLLFDQIADALPNALLVATSPFSGGGPGVWGGSALDVRDAIQTAATTDGRWEFIDLLERPAGRTVKTGTLAAGPSAGATTISSTLYTAPQSFVEIGVPGARERRKVTALSGASPGPYTLTISPALSAAYASGTAIAEVGPPFITGNGKSGATTGNGNADVFTGTDGVHWTDAGHQAVGRLIAQLLATYVLDA